LLPLSARVNLAKVGVGVFVRRGAAKPDISSADAFKRDVFGRYTTECPIDGPQSFEDCAKGNPAASYFPTGCTT
jgi:hypothetical protein